MEVNSDYNIRRLSFAPVWTSWTPPEVLESMLQEEESADN